MDPRDEEEYELVVKNLRYVDECTRRLRSLDEKFDELTASDKKAELDAINALHKSILIKELPYYKVRLWRTNNSTLKKLLSRCVAEEETHLNEANKSNTDNSNVAKEADINHDVVNKENRSPDDIPPCASARPSRRGAQAKKAKTGKRNGRKKQKRTRQSNRKSGDRENLGDSEAFRSDADSNTQIRPADDNESLQSVDIFSDLEDNDYSMEEREDVTRGDNAAGREEEEVTRGDPAADREEEEVTRGDNAAVGDEEEEMRGDPAADREEEEVTREDEAADREKEEVTRGDDAADREQEEVARRPPQSAENETIVPNNSDPPENNGNPELVADNANSNAENPPSTSSKSRKRKRASKSCAKKPKGKKEVKIVPGSLSSKKNDPESTSSDAGSNNGNHLAGDNDSSAALSKSSPRENAPMKKLEANKTKKRGRAIRRPSKSTENTRKSNGSLKSHAPSTHVNFNADCSLSPSPSRDRQPTMMPTPRNAGERGENSQLSSQSPRGPTPRAPNGESPEETTQLPSQPAREPADRNKNGREEQDSVMALPPNTEGNGRNGLAQRSDNDSTRKPAQKRRPRRKRKPWNPRPRKTPSVRNKANARSQSDSRLQYQSVQPEQCAVNNKSSHEPVENPGYPGTQAHAPPRKRQRIVNVNVEVVHRAYLIHRGKTLMRVIETNFGRRVYPAIAPHRLRPLARIQPPIYEVERDPYRMYCYCKSSADGGMIGCDNKNCPYGGWFHYSCAGITNECYAPDGKWYCASCSPYYRDMGEPILTCPEEIPLVIVKEEPPTDDGCGEGPSSEEH